MESVSWGAQYDIALLLLSEGADYKIYEPKRNTNLVHIVAMEDDRKSMWTYKQTADYEKLVKWLEDHGESIERANTDIKRWQSWIMATGEFRREMDAEIAEREAREARDKAAAQKPDQKQ